MINLMAGNNFDKELIIGYDKLNKIHKKDSPKIIEVFGSYQNDPVGCAREEDRLPSNNIENDFYQNLKDFVDFTHSFNIKVNYTLNKSCIGTLEDFDDKTYINHLGQLEQAGVDRFTIAHPLLMELATKFSNIPIEVSTINHTYSVNQIDYYKKLNVSKICMNLNMNRDMQFLYNYNRLCMKAGITLELMANEACIFGCIYRYSHYNQQSHTTVNTKLFDNYPIGRCSELHMTKPVEWLKARLIRPEDLEAYSKLGINNFKITGRTHMTSTQLRIVGYYVNQSLQGNLLDLFPQFHNIYETKKEKSAPFYIDNKKLNNFLDYWWQDLNFRCSESCGICTYCYEVLKKCGFNENNSI